MPNKASGQIRIGISGWLYQPWRGDFYPKGLSQKRELEYASRKLNSIEMNGTFYSLKTPKNFQTWYDTTPDDFIFSIKGSRFITHMRRLKNIEAPLGTFLSQGLLRLGKKLGPILWQLPPNFKYERDRLEDFLALLPATHEHASTFAEKYNEYTKGKPWLKVETNHKLRHAIEIRNHSFVNDEFIKLLRRYKIALVAADTTEWPLLMDVTSDFTYCRLHGSEKLYSSGYSDEALAIWKQRILTWAEGGEVRDSRKASDSTAPKRKSRDVFLYFDNDQKVRAPYDAQSLQSKINQAR